MIHISIIRSEIKRLRNSAGISLNEMARRLAMDKRSYERIESGERKTLDIKLADEIATILGAELGDWIKLASGMSIRPVNDSQIETGSEEVILHGTNKDQMAAFRQLLEEKSAVITAQAGIIAQQKAFIDSLLVKEGSRLAL
jgi:transcriptional regulator with XRE-family HTH domain